jgi:hypothetical protein
MPGEGIRERELSIERWSAAVVTGSKVGTGERRGLATADGRTKGAVDPTELAAGCDWLADGVDPAPPEQATVRVMHRAASDRRRGRRGADLRLGEELPHGTLA